MADMIARLKVDSSEYDAKIQRAARGIQDLARACHDAGGVLNVLEDENREYIQSLGNMATVAQTTRGKIAELTSAFIDIKSVYNSLSDEEKKGEFGRELNRQLDIMKGRIQDGKREIQDISNELNGGGNGLSSALDAVAGKFGLNIGQLTKFGGALALAKGALDTVKGAIESNEATHDALARAISVTDNVTNQFLRSLATADFSNFINGLQSIIDKTIDAYNAMDEFESYAARFQPWQQAKESQIQTKIMQARAAKAKGENDRAEQLNNEAKQLIQELAKSTKAYGEKQTTGGFATIRSLMGQVNISNQQIAWYADPKNWETAKRKAEEYARIQERIKKGNMMSSGAEAHADAQRAQELLNRDPSLLRAYTMQNLRDSGDSKQAQQFRQALGNIYGNTLAESRIESLMARADRMEGMLTRAGGGGGGGGKGGNAEVVAISGSIDEQTKKVQELQKAWRAAADDNSRQKIKAEIEEQQYILDRMTGKETFDPTKIQQITDLSGRTPWATPEMLTKGTGLTLPVKLDIESPEEKLRGELERLQELLKNAWTNAERDALKDAIDNINGQLDDMSGKNKKKKGPEEGGDYIGDTSKVVSGLNSVASGLQQMGIKLPDGVQKIMGVAQGLMTVIQGVQSIIGIFTTTTATAQTTATSANSIAVSTNTGAIATLAGAVTANTTALVANSATNFFGSYANGGVVPHAANGYFVPGSHYSGDVTPIMANAGELVLSRSQQGVLAAELEGGNGRNVNITGVLRGEDIVLVADKWGKRTGKGELLFAKNL